MIAEIGHPPSQTRYGRMLAPGALPISPTVLSTDAMTLYFCHPLQAGRFYALPLIVFQYSSNRTHGQAACNRL